MILTNLIKIDVYRNSLTGPIPDISALASLELADFEENRFSGPAFAGIPGASTALTSYRVSRNTLTGTIPTAIGVLTNLSELWFANNLVTGTIPMVIGQLTALSKYGISGEMVEGERDREDMMMMRLVMMSCCCWLAARMIVH